MQREDRKLCLDVRRSKMAKTRIKHSENIAVSSKKLRCFIIMPISPIKFEDKNGNSKTLAKGQLDYIYKKFFQRVFDEYNNQNVGFSKPHRSEQKRGNFVKGIVNALSDYDLVLADLTGFNPNVFYELGIRHTIRNGTILVTQNKKSLPADLKTYITCEYEYPDDAAKAEECYARFKKEIHDAIDEFLQSPKKPDNPVRDFIGDRQIFRNEIRIKQLQGNVSLLRYLQLVYCRDVNSLLTRLEKWATGDRELFNMAILPVLDKLLSKLVTQNENFLFINYLFGLLNSCEVINTNQKGVSLETGKSKDVTSSKEFGFGFYDFSNKHYYLLDLKEYHKESSGQSIITDDPIVKSLKILESHWQDELQNLLQ